MSTGKREKRSSNQAKSDAAPDELSQCSPVSKSSTRKRKAPGQAEFNPSPVEKSTTFTLNSTQSAESGLMSFYGAMAESMGELGDAMSRLLSHTIDMAWAAIAEKAHYQLQVVQLQEALEKAREEAAVERAERMRLTSEIAHFMPSKVLSQWKLIDPNVSEIAEVVPLPPLEDHHEDLN
ncbi:hypothetical protein KIN20_035561 [Parelaphostrongylus tenuis]|uniref:Uncharacterized protein n=1 Tax=Parelaphostrongylus tenuis TaxID=148309 RepID=A0AAD5RBB6_PARTN|nr:hypothetical protein KIN20_035561 [Parelaphostrongylus tenuis]